MQPQINRDYLLPTLYYLYSAENTYSEKYACISSVPVLLTMLF